MATIKYSRQRESIKRYVMSREDHPTVDMVYAAVKKEYPSISLSTVYRNLTFLADHGIISRLSAGKGVERFDPNISPHYHFICTECGSVTDLNLPWTDEMEKAAAEGFSGEIEGHVSWFYGKCSKCKRSGSSEPA